MAQRTRRDFHALLADVKGRIQTAQTRAVLAVNAELVRLYWDIGRLIGERQERAGWGAAVIPRLTRALHNELPDLKGFSERNIKLMVQFASEYPHAFTPPDSIGQPAVAQLPLTSKGQLPVARIPWAHNILAVANFEQHLPASQSDLVRQTLKDPYIFDFLTLAEPFQERELETGLIRHLEKFLLELGQGFLSSAGRSASQSATKTFTSTCSSTTYACGRSSSSS